MKNTPLFDMFGRRRCSKCGTYKPLSRFSRDRHKASGYTSHCKSCRAVASRRWAEANPERSASYTQDWRKYYYGRHEENRRKKREYAHANRATLARYARERRAKNPQAKVVDNLRGRLNLAIRDAGAYKAGATIDLLGCSREMLVAYLESKFVPGMTWSNYGRGRGKWHVDHITPCCAFDLRNEDEQRACFRFSNLRPMWAVDNILKAKADKRLSVW